MEDCVAYKDLLDNLYEGVYFVDTGRKITYWNKGAERISGYSASEVVGSRCADNILVHIDERGKELCKHGCPLVSAMLNGKSHCEDRVYLHHKSGHRVPVAVSVSTIRDPGGTAVGAIEVFRDTDSRTLDPQLIEDLKRAALLDTLTGLPNRRYIEMKLSASFEELRRHGIPFGVLFADIDHFKRINDTYGHSAGDNVLKMVGSTLHGNMRAYDMVGRWGGEEFIAVVSHVDRDQLLVVADKLRSLVEHSFLSHGDIVIRVTATMGATLARPDDTQESLLERADRLLYRGKSCGRNCSILEE
ncbi:MAG: sensor domain-containing diguanylate cyclase [Alphaproteobacteria bacterium]|uniref:Sensor domain-containing diguanylate cyclase n=1 Tax=Candidatus Nitrobium versatile TaxID=2884831 RepID=A0A953M268_9BACT|nr:sensor domain-containing diguanylate cyclase [Candidatus Nitrobium versatile]